MGDRLVESLRIAREVGGTDLGHLLRTLSGFLREDARTRAELETRQSLDRQRRPARGRRAVGSCSRCCRPTPSRCAAYSSALGVVGAGRRRGA